MLVSKPTQITIDKSLLSKMKLHQVEASKFLLNRLMGYTRIESATIDPSLITGAILADDMGTGKVMNRLLYPPYTPSFTHVYRIYCVIDSDCAGCDMEYM